MIYSTVNRASRPFLVAAFIAMAIMVVFSGTAFAQGRPLRAGVGKGINLSDAQRQKLQRHIKESRKRTAGVVRELLQARTTLFNQLQDYKVDENQLQESVRKINGLQIRLHNIGLENQLKLRSILTKSQFAQLGEAVSGNGVGRHIHGWPTGNGGLIGENLKRLDITSAQQEKIKRLFVKSRSTMQSISQELRQNAQSLHRLYLNYDLDPQEAKTLIAKLGKTQRKAMNATVSRQLALREILTRQQFETLSQTMRPPTAPRWQNGRGK
ncbi:MAG: periplasmic heavy metal sensor [Armatimonadota bacterium]